MIQPSVELDLSQADAWYTRAARQGLVGTLEPSREPRAQHGAPGGSYGERARAWALEPVD